MIKNLDLNKMTKADLIAKCEQLIEENEEKDILRNDNMSDEVDRIDSMEGIMAMFQERSSSLYFKYFTNNRLPQDVMEFIERIKDLDIKSSDTIEKTTEVMRNEPTII